MTVLNIRRIAPSLAALLLSVASATALAQAGPDLAELAKKDNLSAAERTTAGEKLLESLEKLRAADTDKSRSSERQKLVATVRGGNEAFRGAVAAVVAKELGAALKQPVEQATDAAMVLAALEHPAALRETTDALASRYAGVRYLAARSLKAMQPKLETPEQYNTALIALGETGATETDAVVMAAIYEAIDFAAGREKFPGAASEGAAVARVLSARLEQGAAAFDPTIDTAAFAAAFRVGAEIKDPPRELTEALARSLKWMAESTVSGGSAGMAEAVGECEAALYRILEKHGTQTAGLTRLQDLLQGEPDAQKVNAALAKLCGGDGVKGVLNSAPWNLPAALEGEMKKKAR